MVGAVGDQRGFLEPVRLECRQHAAHARVEPREAREEEARQPRLLKVLGRVEPARLQPRLRDGNRTLVGRVVPAVGTVVRHAEALAVIAAHEAERAQLAQHAVACLLPAARERHVAGGRAADVDPEGGGHCKGLVRHGARKVEKEGLAPERRLADELRRSRRHPLRVVRALLRLPIAAPHGERPRKATVGAHHLAQLLVVQPPAMSTESRATLTPLRREREAKVVLAREGRKVAVPPQRVRNRLHAVQKRVEAHQVPRPVHGDRARVACEAAREQPEPARRAQRRSGVGPVEGDTLTREALDVRREAVLCAVGGEHVARHVVGDDQDHVGRVGHGWPIGRAVGRGAAGAPISVLERYRASDVGMRSRCENRQPANDGLRRGVEARAAPHAPRQAGRAGRRRARRVRVAEQPHEFRRNFAAQRPG